ncbi:MAG TPA: M20/M25/M40 family metallo-hydrolase, partial [Thermoanaerobaculia bacterium]|nr:M20/M25/M40 family metallo-hydrolase [Thermoanaerobaculia bacterium]
MEPAVAILPEPLLQKAVGFLRELTRVSSDSGDPAGLRNAAEHLAAALRERGLATEIRDESPGADSPPLPVLYARGPDTTRGHLLLIGHLDTVLPAIEPHLEGGRLIATGAIDMKGGLAAFVGALDLLRDRGQRPPADLMLVVVPDEEVGGALSQAAVRRWGETARALWVLEPGEPAGDAETIVAGRRGMFEWRLDVRGQAAHSGLHYWDGRSALAAAARWVAEAEALSRPDGGPTINAGRFVGGDATFVEGLATAHALLGTDRQLNVVPDRAIVEGEARFLSPGESLELQRRLEALARDVAIATGTEISFAASLFIPPVDPRGPHGGLCQRATTLAAARGWRLEIEEERGGISFLNFLPDPGRIPVLDGLGPVGGGMHTREEYVELRSLRRRIVLLADLLGEDGGRMEREQDLDARATAFKEVIERRLASGPAMPMDFSEL